MTAFSRGFTLKMSTKVELKIKASKHKSQIRLSQNSLGFSNTALTKSFFDFYLVYNSFCLKRVRLKFLKLLYAIFWLQSIKNNSVERIAVMSVSNFFR